MKKIFLSIFVFLSVFSYSIGAEKMERIKFSFDNKEIIVALENNSAAESLLKQLPLTLKFENYSSTEKISYPPEKLDISKAPNSCTPKDGDLTYYAPWGNLAFFYKNFRNSNGLVPLGKIISGRENLESIDSALVVKAEEIK